MTSFHLWVFSKNQKVIFPKTTFQRIGYGDDFECCENSRLVHAKKHPEVLSVLGWKREDVVLLSEKGLVREYSRAVKKLCQMAVQTKAKETRSRGMNRVEVNVQHNDITWLIVFEQEFRNLGSVKDANGSSRSVLCPIGLLKLVTCFPRNWSSGYSTNPETFIKWEFERLSRILYTETSHYLKDLLITIEFNLKFDEDDFNDKFQRFREDVDEFIEISECTPTR
jgi:hypothetical protein